MKSHEMSWEDTQMGITEEENKKETAS